MPNREKHLGRLETYGNTEFSGNIFASWEETILETSPKEAHPTIFWEVLIESSLERQESIVYPVCRVIFLINQY